MVLGLLFPVGFLTVALVDDLLFKKFHNWLFLTLSTVGFLFVLLSGSFDPVQSLGGFFTGGVLMLPLVLLGATGAGDMKFMMSFGILMGSVSIFEIFIYSLFWGAFIGMLQSFFAGKIQQVIKNLIGFLYKLKLIEVQKIPYIAAIFLGWMTHHFHGGFF